MNYPSTCCSSNSLPVLPIKRGDVYVWQYSIAAKAIAHNSYDACFIERDKAGISIEIYRAKKLSLITFLNYKLKFKVIVKRLLQIQNKMSNMNLIQIFQII